MISPLLDDIFRAALANEASDIILQDGKSAVLRINGELATVESRVIGGEDLDALWAVCGAGRDELDHDASFATEDGVRFRANLFRQLGQRGAVLRRIQNQIPSMESLGLPADLLREWAARPSGIVIVCGATSSGKSTTMASLIEWINTTMARHVVTIEDPVEFLFSGKLSFFTQREVGIDTPSFAEGLRRSLRQNPDVIFLGEIRDAASALTALQAAETGHLVLATVHAAGCSDVVARLELLFPSEEREAVRVTLAAQLHGILCQRLLPSVAGGRALATEYFSNAGSSRKLIAEGRMNELRDFVMRGDPRSVRTFGDSLLELVRSGTVAEAVAMDFAENPQEFARALRGVTSSSQATRK